MVVLAILALILGIGLPNLLHLVFRARLEGLARQTATLMQSARLNAIKNQRQALVQIDSATRLVVAFIDEDEDTAMDPGEFRVGQVPVPAGVDLRAPGTQSVFDGFDTQGTRGFAVFHTDGSVDRQGAFRLADTHDNFLEVRVAPRGTARIKVRKWDGTDWWARDEGGHAWEWE
jgi:Tfp pilus assembly protein FimT